MSQTSMLSSNGLAVKLWSAKTFVDMMKTTAFGRMYGQGNIMVADELNGAALSRAGDQVTFGFAGILSGIGQTEGGTMTGNEESLNLQNDTMVFNVVRNAVANPNEDTIEQQRTLIKFEDTSRTLLRDWHGSRLDASVFNQLAGVDSTTILVDGTTYSGANKTIVQGLNGVRAPTSSRLIIQSGQANDQSLTASDTFTLDLIDAALELAMRTYPTIVPLANGEFDLYISWEQLTDLKRDSSGKITWYANSLSAVTGGNSQGNALFDGGKAYNNITPVAKYANVNIIPSPRVAYGVNSGTSAAITSVRRAVLVGKNALAFGSPFGNSLAGKGDSNVPLKFKTQLKDYEYIKGVEARLIYGLRKIQFAGQDFGVITISTYANSHAA